MKKITHIPWLSAYMRLTTILLPIFYLVGLIAHSIDRLLPAMLVMTPYTIFFTLVLIFLPYFVLGSKRLLTWTAVTAIITLLLEIVGVETGMVFGGYDYGSTLGIKLLGVPLIIGLNWVMVVLGAISLMEKFTDYFWHKVLGTAVITTLFDFVMEPVAMKLDYWMWDGGVIPLQNYIAWAVISAGAAILYERLKLSNREHYPVRVILIVQLLFFIGLRILL
jgi:bisanhydrobacterioruberin hydratase